jgi:hypothetical protein
MIVVVASSPDGTALLSLEQPDDCTRFHVEGRGLDAEQVGAALAASGVGTLQEDHAYLQPAVIARLAQGLVAADWLERFDGMLAYAQRKGWVDATGAVMAHLEWS